MGGIGSGRPPSEETIIKRLCEPKNPIVSGGIAGDEMFLPNHSGIASNIDFKNKVTDQAVKTTSSPTFAGLTLTDDINLNVTSNTTNVIGTVDSFNPIYYINFKNKLGETISNGSVQLRYADFYGNFYIGDSDVNGQIYFGDTDTMGMLYDSDLDELHIISPNAIYLDGNTFIGGDGSLNLVSIGLSSIAYLEADESNNLVISNSDGNVRFSVPLNKGIYVGSTIIYDDKGFPRPKTSTDANAPTNSIYYSSTQSKLVYKDGAGNVNNLY